MNKPYFFTCVSAELSDFFSNLCSRDDLDQEGLVIIIITLRCFNEFHFLLRYPIESHLWVPGIGMIYEVDVLSYF